MRRPSHLVIAGVALLLAACGGAAPTPSPAPTAAPTAAPTLPPTQAPTAPPTAPPTVPPTAPPSDVPSLGCCPVELLISYAHPDLRDSCRERDRIYAREAATITCASEDLPFDYSLFTSWDDMDAAFDDDVAGAETLPQPNGECNQGNFLQPYEVDGRVGRVNCREDYDRTTGAQHHIIEWTDENLLVIGYISNRVDVHTWDALIAFWLNQAGPYAP